MTLRRSALFLLVALAAVIPATASAKPPLLAGTVGPGFAIDLTKSGRHVKTLPAGIYTIVVSDRSSIHDFHLTGKGVNKSTPVAFTGKQTWTVTLKPGRYTYQCDPHSFAMHGSFRVTS